MNTVNNIRMKLQEALTQEREKYADDSMTEWSEHDRGLADGWIEALEYAIAVVVGCVAEGKPMPTIMDWNRIQDEAIIGLHRLAIAQLEEGDVEEAIGVLTRTINQLRGVKVGDEE